MSWGKPENLIVEIGRKSQENDRKSKNGVADRDMINLKTAVDFNAEAQRRKVTQRKSEVI
jgi:hypothetical protein